MTRLTLAAFSCLAALGCNDTDLPPIELSPGNQAVFADQVQPYVGLGCGSLDCHGDRGRALRLFAKFGLRERDDLRALPIDQSEVAANVRAFAAFDVDDFADNLILTKGLAVSSGGLAHEGGDIWASTDADGYQCLLAFLSDGQNESACAEALAEIDVD